MCDGDRIKIIEEISKRAQETNWVAGQVSSESIDEVIKRDLQYLEQLEIQEKWGYPSFKQAIVQHLVEDYKLNEKEAQLSAFSSKLHNELLNDIAWAQHMGPEYWAEVIANDLEGFLNPNK